MKTVLVTGGGGFLGSNLVAGLTARGDCHVAVCDRFGTSEKWRNLAKHPVWEIIPPEQLMDWLASRSNAVEAVFHTAAASSTTEKDIDFVLKQNLALSIALWRWCNKNEVRFIYTSSVATYGDGSQGFEDNHSLDYLTQLRPLNGYGWSKHLFDLHVASAIKAGEVRTPQWVGLKVFNAYGPNEYHKDLQASVISQIAPHAILGGGVRIFRSYNPNYPDGGQQRDVFYVKDFTNVMLWLYDHPNVTGLFNLGSGKASTYNEMAHAIFAAIKREPRITYIDMPEDIVHKYQYFTEAKMDRLRSAGYTQPFTSLAEGVRDYVTHYLSKEDKYL